jgi:hypothetical protein
MCGDSTGVTHRECEGTWFPRNPTGVGFVFFAATLQKTQTPLCFVVQCACQKL